MSADNTPAPLPPVPDGHPHADALSLIATGARRAEIEATFFPAVAAYAAREAQIAASLRASYLDLLALDGRDVGRDAEDAARLDALDANAWDIKVGHGPNGAEWFVYDSDGWVPEDGTPRPTVREAIDAARAASADGAEGAK